MLCIIETLYFSTYRLRDLGDLDRRGFRTSLLLFRGTGDGEREDDRDLNKTQTKQLILAFVEMLTTHKKGMKKKNHCTRTILG